MEIMAHPTLATFSKQSSGSNKPASHMRFWRILRASPVCQGETVLFRRWPMRKYATLIGLVGASILSGCGSSADQSATAPQVETQAGGQAVKLPADFPSDIVLPEDTRLVLASTPVPGDVFIEGRSRQSAEAIVEGFTKRLSDAGYTLTDRAKTTDPLEIYFEGKQVEGGNIRVRDDGADRDFMLTYTKAGQ
ncbi:hypothetical protein IDJ81_09085 [Tsuneonella flava]|uniref:Beta-hexosaminidase bacterial type N-terminal domain-containing protein n=1 Tax=Tsuneonella flava TaxID=2055955 RepID=A0ABX7KAK7_9SPHN|nr:hypothetical protein [Tsuneonella flava]QSB43540.1 hypothetical protein IDJ81_09085 [Tsuneonella flava]